MKIHLNIVKKNDKPINEVMKDLFRQNKKMSKGYIAKRIRMIWKSEMGPTIWSYTKSLYLREQILYINITSSPLRHELSMSKEKILTLINDKFGRKVVEKVVIK